MVYRDVSAHRVSRVLCWRLAKFSTVLVSQLHGRRVSDWYAKTRKTTRLVEEYCTLFHVYLGACTRQGLAQPGLDNAAQKVLFGRGSDRQRVAFIVCFSRLRQCRRRDAMNDISGSRWVGRIAAMRAVNEERPEALLLRAAAFAKVKFCTDEKTSCVGGRSALSRSQKWPPDRLWGSGSKCGMSIG